MLLRRQEIGRIDACGVDSQILTTEDGRRKAGGRGNLCFYVRLEPLTHTLYPDLTHIGSHGHGIFDSYASFLFDSHRLTREQSPRLIRFVLI
jgi:hypothetical protein